MIDRQNRASAVVKEDAAVASLRASGLVDEEWYRRQYPVVAMDVLDPVSHYVYHGAAEGRNPNSHFYTLSYIQRYPTWQQQT